MVVEGTTTLVVEGTTTMVEEETTTMVTEKTTTMVAEDVCKTRLLSLVTVANKLDRYLTWLSSIY